MIAHNIDNAEESNRVIKQRNIVLGANINLKNKSLLIKEKLRIIAINLLFEILFVVSRHCC